MDGVTIFFVTIFGIILFMLFIAMVHKNKRTSHQALLNNTNNNNNAQMDPSWEEIEVPPPPYTIFQSPPPPTYAEALAMQEIHQQQPHLQNPQPMIIHINYETNFS